MNTKIKNALLLTWGEISFCIGEAVSNIVGRKIICHAGFEDKSYWDVAINNDTFSVQELKAILCSVNASKLMYDETIPSDSDYSRSLGMRLSEALLEYCIGTSWEHLSISDDGIWLVGIDSDTVNLPKMSPDTIYVEDCLVDTAKLITKNEIMEYLEETDGMGSDLDEICQKNLIEYDSKLYWYCPLPSKDNEGYYFVLVREGVLCIPYNSMYDRDEELALGDAKLFNSREMFNVKCEWDEFAETTSRILNSLAFHLMDRGGSK